MSDESSAEYNELTQAREKFDRTERLVRRIGLAVMFGTLALILGPMVVATIQGVRNDNVRDPYTGELVAVDERGLDCEDEAGELIHAARSEEGADQGWSERHRQWVNRCREDYPEIAGLLMEEKSRVDEMLDRE